ncbi:uncharacterized protein TM35_000601290 [Trypanosoma theileri]|uniref:Mucin TcMUCII n=1 Tax=Trypanosoma theileri TaxID=67003 RepID=A0A1X0NGQ3_9TRYP|nr:uncharacterized protein TM35_000601290 [Trypanosoma theileri]ORC83698.1 hypothetical protein TM35_000601290 [Trypanosoma theileri]
MLMRRLLCLVALLLSLHCMCVVAAGEPAKGEVISPGPGQPQVLPGGGECTSEPSCKTDRRESEASPEDCGNPPKKEDCTTIVSKTQSTCSKASEGAEDTTSCPTRVGSPPPPPPPPPPISSNSDDTSCNTVSGVSTAGSCPNKTNKAPGAGGADISTQVSASGVGPEESEKQQQLESQRETKDDALPGPPGTSHGKGQAVSQPVVPQKNERGHDNEKNGDQGVSAEGSPTGPVISGGADQNNGNQQPGGNGSQSSESSGVSNTDTRDSQSNQSDTTEQPQSSDNNQTSQGHNGEAENTNDAAKPAEGDSTKDTESTTNNEESTTTTTTTTTLPPELTNNKKGDADSSSSISSSVWVRVPLLIVVTLSCILAC